MRERIIEIIVYLISELNHNHPIDEVTFDRLSDQGYSTTEISAAFSWLFDKIHFGNHSMSSEEFARSSSLRFLNNAEKEIISPEIHGYLIQLYQLGLLGNEHLEMTIERAIATGYRNLTIEQLHSIIATILFDAESTASGSRLMLNGDDTIH